MLKHSIISSNRDDRLLENSLMKKRTLRTLMKCLILVLHGPNPVDCFAEQAYFLDKERGWFWREEFIEPAKPKPKKEKQPTPVSTRDSIEEIQPLSVAWLRKNLEKYRDQAIDAPPLKTSPPISICSG